MVNNIIHLSNKKLSISLIQAKTGVGEAKSARFALLTALVSRSPREVAHPSYLPPTYAALHILLRLAKLIQQLRALNVSGMWAVTKKKQPQLTKHHWDKCYASTLSKKDWTVEDWKRVVWSDETKINRIGSDGRKWVWKKKGEGLSDWMVEGMLKFGGGSLIFWGCFRWKGTDHSCKITGKMDADLCPSCTIHRYNPGIEKSRAMVCLTTPAVASGVGLGPLLG
ncbi:hypothetical protein ONZ51_g375 [Trametes cubensis]|uniref:Transposable element Tc1 transposase n=1 Tax=Trametes cubensis TaxID=1111947 RepID=A0AAD7XFV2_9APHY|nr:hypothetical protein ONZ51_g375 [Trametes cubensis]